jgi:FtsP/CotA-like multicopper oxidase with cupredoxin domain
MLSRRAVLTGALAGSAGFRAVAEAQNPPAGGPEGNAAPRTIFRLERRNIEVNGKSASVYGIRQPDGTFGITTDVGKPFRVRLENRIEEPSLIHWHGLTPPWQQDGVPGISGPPIPPGGNADYDFPLRFGGTFWMHSHQGLQEQLLMAAPLIIHDRRDRADQQEFVVMLTDFSFTQPDQIFAELKKTGSSASRPATRSARKGSMAGMAKPGARAKPDLNDVKYDAFLANDRTLADREVIKVEPGGRALLRIINSSSMSAYHIDLGSLDGELTAVDGFAITSVKARNFPIAVAQRLDIRLTIPRTPASYPVLAVLEGERKQTGVILAAGKASVTRIPDLAKLPSSALTLGLEGRLRALRPLTPRKADRVHTINLTGDMARYIWSLNNVAWNPSVPPLPIANGERVELVMVNLTGMPHPMHLHGHEFQVVEIDGKRFQGAVRDTVLVPPGRRVVVAFDANNPGW